jgi:23S rRNA (adenine2503-C2)-methyltransferase
LRNDYVSTPILPLHGGGKFNSPEVVDSVSTRQVGLKFDLQCDKSSTVKPALAISLHSTNAELRAKLLPHAPQISVEVLVERAEVYARATGYPIQYQWTLIEGVNDSDAEVERIAALLKGKYALMNFIPFNAVDGLPYRRPSVERTAEMMHTLNRQGIYSRVRDSAGQEVEGACGQLRARASKEHKPARIKVHTQ